MSIFIVLEFIDVDVLRVGGRRIILLVVLEYLLDDQIIIVRLGLFLRHLHSFAASWSVVVTE